MYNKFIHLYFIVDTKPELHTWHYLFITWFITQLTRYFISMISFGRDFTLSTWYIYMVYRRLFITTFMCKAKRQYMLTFQVSRYCLLALWITVSDLFTAILDIIRKATCPLDTQRCCDVESTWVTLIQRRNNVVFPVGDTIGLRDNSSLCSLNTKGRNCLLEKWAVTAFWLCAIPWWPWKSKVQSGLASSTLYNAHSTIPQFSFLSNPWHLSNSGRTLTILQTSHYTLGSHFNC